MELHGRRAGGRAEHYPGAGLGSVRRRAFLGSRFSPRSGNGELMNQLAMQEEDYSDEPTQAKGDVEWQLQKLKPKHLQICSLLAQGFKNIEVAKLTGVTKEYITMLLRQPLIKQEISRKKITPTSLPRRKGRLSGSFKSLSLSICRFVLC